MSGEMAPEWDYVVVGSAAGGDTLAVRLAEAGMRVFLLEAGGDALATKGARSYYPPFCTVAQTDQVLDVHHRPGNIHDSNGADAFSGHFLHSMRSALPRMKIETRIDSAFFNATIAEQLHGTHAEFTISVPFERFPELEGMIEGRIRWRRLNDELSFFESYW
jgi:choline dehydrogenase-like flavoprotein